MNSRAIYPESFTKNLPYTIFLLASKLLKCFGLYLAYDILKTMNVVPFLLLVNIYSTLIFIFLQKPFSSGKRLTKNQWFKIARYSFMYVLINVVWMFGLTQCGPLRTLLLYEHSGFIVVSLFAALFTNAGNTTKMRGAVFFILAALGLLAFDHDDMREHAAKHGDNHQHTGVVSHLFEHMTHFTGLSDHKGGVMLLFVTLFAKTGYDTMIRKFGVEIGGSKRCHAFISLLSFLWLFPWTIYNLSSFDNNNVLPSTTTLLISTFFVAFSVFILDYYVDNVAIQRLNNQQTARLQNVTIIIFSVLIGYFWKNTYMLDEPNSNVTAIIEDHQMSGGVIFSIVLFFFATLALTTTSRTTRGSFIGYSPNGLPLYHLSGEAFQKTSHSLFLFAKKGLKQILNENDSRKIFYFLCINLAFTFVELIYGAWTNSLGLISDGFHMLFDCSALVMGLYAAVMSKWPATKTFSYGYDRVEILSGFINGLFLVVIAFFVFSEAIGRLLEPPEIRTERLLSVAVIGLLVNLVGIMSFSHGHSHGGGSHGHSHGSVNHGHSHEGENHGHSHRGSKHGHSHESGNHGHSHGNDEHNKCSSEIVESGHTLDQGNDAHSHGGSTQNTNMRGVFLHVLADTLGSVGVIISSLLIENFGWNIADPICSLFIAIMIFLSVLPLLKDTVDVLLLQTPSEIEADVKVLLNKILYLDGVISYSDEHVWRHSSNVLAATIHIQIDCSAYEQKILSEVTNLFKHIGVNNIAVQIEKDIFFQHLTGLGRPIDEIRKMKENVKSRVSLTKKVSDNKGI